MVLTCPKCTRTNPADASYCYLDGTALRAVNHHHQDPAVRPFPAPFIFPSGLACQNFDQLALGCINNWQSALDLLRQGFFVGFLGGLGRADLAQAAREAAKYPDPDRGLEQFVSKLPAKSVEAPKLGVEPKRVNLGQLRVGKDLRFELGLTNDGMGLLYGSIAAEDCPWLALGDAPGLSTKLFQFRDRATIPVQVRGQSLRASNNPIEGKLVVQCNGGTTEVLVTAEVPVVPFPDGVLAGARTPRQVAEKAKANPKGAAASFENGSVERWYQNNGWSYPVLGPSASGLAAVQQFFEALGLTKPPKVEINETSLTFVAKPGEKMTGVLKVSTQEKRPVYARAVCDQPWIRVGKVDLEGRSATIHLVIASVPDTPGDLLEANVTVTSNGNQKFVVLVRLSVTGARRVRSAPVLDLVDVVASPGPVAAHIPVLTLDDEPAYPTAVRASSNSSPPVAVAVPVPQPMVMELLPLDEPPPVRSRSSPVIEAGGIRAVSAPVASLDDLDDDPDRRRGSGGKWKHLIPVGLIALGLLVAMIRDVVIARNAPPIGQGPLGGGGDDGPPEPGPTIRLNFHDKNISVTLGTAGMKPGGGGPGDLRRPATWEPSMRFGIVMVPLQGGEKKLTFAERGFPVEGLTNNTCIKLDGKELLFGDRGFLDQQIQARVPPNLDYGNWADAASIRRPLTGGRDGYESVWHFPQENVVITQTVEVVKGSQTRRPDTCVVRYKIENRDPRNRRDIGIRFMLDTYIGGNDGVPFLIPGEKTLCSDQRDISSRFTRMPDFIQAYENESLTEPGTVAQIQLKLGEKIEPPTRVTLGAYPNPRLNVQLVQMRQQPRAQQDKTMWDVPLLPIKTLDNGDSCVVLYWDPMNIGPGSTREVGFAYGLGTISATEGKGSLALTVGGSFTAGEEFTATAYVSNPKPGQTVTLTLPSGFSFVEGAETQPVPEAVGQRRVSPVTWRIKAPGSEGRFELKAQLNTGEKQSATVRISKERIFGR